MAKLPADPLEFDPLASPDLPPKDTVVTAAPTPEVSSDATRIEPRREGGGLSAAELFGDSSHAGARARARSAGFSEATAKRGAGKTAPDGAETLDTSAFLSRSEREALERAKAVPHGSLPSLIEHEELASAVRVVDEKRTIWYWYAGIVLLLLAIGIAVVAVHNHRETKRLEQEVEHLRAPAP